MEKSVMGLVAAIGAVAPLAGAHASVTSQEANQALQAKSVAELLDPAPNAVAILSRLDADRKTQTRKDVQLAQYYYHHHHHHYYHHHNNWNGYYNNYHHHHHHWYRHHHHWNGGW